MRRLHSSFAFAAVLVLVGGGAVAESTAVREYVPGAWSMSFYRPHQLQITGIGLVNRETAYFSTRSGVSELQEGHLKRLPMEVELGEISAFHLCHHRNSFFYEVRARDGGTVTIFEHSLLFENKLQVWESEDVSPATSLACVDKLLLRASSSSLLAINVESAEGHGSDKEPAAVSVLFEYDSRSEAANAIASLAIGYAADVFTRAQVYALAPHNRTLLRLHLEEDHVLEKVVAESEPLLHGGDGSDGPLDVASAFEPLFVLSSHDAVLFADGCALRQISDGHVRTLLGVPGECVHPSNETVEPAPWASRLSRPEALAGVTEETLEGTVLALTGSQVFSVEQRQDVCSQHADAGECSAQAGCGWAEADNPGEQLCFGCDRLHEWAGRHAVVDPCELELEPRARTRYNLVGCGCIAPVWTTPEPSEDTGLEVFQIFVGGSILAAVAGCMWMLHRASRRQAAMRELYGADTCEFHVFNDLDDH
jgi:hypothetical protein